METDNGCLIFSVFYGLITSNSGEIAVPGEFTRMEDIIIVFLYNSHTRMHFGLAGG